MNDGAYVELSKRDFWTVLWSIRSLVCESPDYGNEN